MPSPTVLARKKNTNLSRIEVSKTIYSTVDLVQVAVKGMRPSSICGNSSQLQTNGFDRFDYLHQTVWRLLSLKAK